MGAYTEVREPLRLTHARATGLVTVFIVKHGENSQLADTETEPFRSIDREFLERCPRRSSRRSAGTHAPKLGPALVG
jgi:hypothetical protein